VAQLQLRQEEPAGAARVKAGVTCDTVLGSKMAGAA